jgi:outer membrane receptor protein involved in Fe transport
MAYLFCVAVSPSVSAQGGGELLDLSLEELGNVLVTGTRIPGVGVPAAMITVARDEFEDAGFSSVEELFESLPQNFDEITPDGRFANEGGSLLRGLNNSRVSSIDLRGLGAQSTLTLVNGKRRAGSIDGRVVDVSAIPISFLERVEVVTGGRSAIYGADAVAGVVNLVTRRNFEGVESRVSYGQADGGGERFQLSQIVGFEVGRGSFVAAYDFSRDHPLDLADVGLLSLMPNPTIGLTQLSLNAQADTRRQSAYLAGQFDVTADIEIYAEGFYSDKKFEDFALRFFEGATQNSFTDTVNPIEHLTLSAGARAAVGEDWTLDVSGGWSEADDTNRSSLFIDLGFTSITSESEQRTTSTLPSVSAVLNGPLLSIGGTEGRAAIGVEWRKEELDSAFNGVPQSDLDRTLRSVFAELSLPLVEGGRPGIGDVELSLAGRYDDYSDFGGTFNPQIGIIWSPTERLTFRGAFSTAFRAPALVELESSVDAFLELVPDPAQGGAAVPVLFVQGEDPDLEAEEAETLGIGVDFRPAFARWAEVSLSYFHIDYDGRIEQPSINADRGLVLERADRFPGLLVRNPTVAEAAGFLAGDADGLIENDTGVPFDPATQDIMDVFPNLVLFDNRLGNVAVEAVRGFDLAVDGDFETELGMFELGINLTHSFEHDRKVTPTSPPFSLLNEVGKPTDTRLRAKGGWIQGAYGAFLYINYVDGYANPFSTPESDIASWTTVDLSLRFDGAEFTDEGFLNGLDATLSVRNLLDNDPPLFTDSLLGVLYDSTNASPFGRYVSLRLSKRW